MVEVVNWTTDELPGAEPTGEEWTDVPIMLVSALELGLTPVPIIEDLVEPVPTSVYEVPVGEGILLTEVILLEEATKVVLNEDSTEVCLEAALEVVSIEVVLIEVVDGCRVVDAELQSNPTELIPTLQDAFPVAAVWVWLAEE
jgi:hypothetical protein